MPYTIPGPLNTLSAQVLKEICDRADLGNTHRVDLSAGQEAARRLVEREEQLAAANERILALQAQLAEARQAAITLGEILDW